MRLVLFLKIPGPVLCQITQFLTIWYNLWVLDFDKKASNRCPSGQDLFSIEENDGKPMETKKYVLQNAFIGNFFAVY